jgi:hypothetical protein
MSNEEDKKSSNEASLPKPTQAGRIEQCQEAIKEAMRCLENNDEDCVTRLIEELVRNQCHNGYVIGREVVGKVKGVVHELWLASSGDNEFKCELLRMFRDLGVLKGWVRDALGMFTKMLNKWLRRCGFSWESRTTRNNVIKEIEDLLRERFGWSEVGMCEELWRFVGVDVDEFRKHGVDPCIWLKGLEELSNLRNPYWLGLARSNLAVEKHNRVIELMLKTTNSISAVFFLTLLSTIETPSLFIRWQNKAPAAKYVHKRISLDYYVELSANDWSWPIKLSANELERIIEGFSNEKLAMFVAGLIDGDGTVWYDLKNGYVAVFISACKKCPKRFILDVLKDIIAKKFGIISRIKSRRTTDDLEFSGENAVKLLRRIVMYVHHPLRHLRAELILALYDGRINLDEFKRLYEQTEYEQGKDDIKRNRGLETLARAAPQTHTHGA